jgi:hypothetical protein
MQSQYHTSPNKNGGAVKLATCYGMPTGRYFKEIEQSLKEMKNAITSLALVLFGMIILGAARINRRMNSQD